MVGFLDNSGTVSFEVRKYKFCEMLLNFSFSHDNFSAITEVVVVDWKSDIPTEEHARLPRLIIKL